MQKQVQWAVLNVSEYDIEHEKFHPEAQHAYAFTKAGASAAV